MIQSQAIQILDPLVSARIAAGEVVEQPASAVRELLDNSIDAGAKQITVDLLAGGINLIRVSDNGRGMGVEDLRLAVLKHATSKIRKLDDLERTTSMGFRGEALFALAAVSELRIVSDPGSGGHEIAVDNGAIGEVKAAALPRGTIVEVKGLFNQLPARKAFLKSPRAETLAVKRVLIERMLAWPQVGFCLTNDGRILLKSAAGDFLARINDLYSSELAESLLAVEHSEAGLDLSGFVSPLKHSSGTKRDQFCMINGRPVFLPLFSRAIAQAYGNQLPEGRNPLVFLNLKIPPERVNPNIHPAKREVRLNNESQVFSLILSGVKAALLTRENLHDFPRLARAASVYERAPTRDSWSGGGGLALDPVAPTASRRPSGFSLPPQSLGQDEAGVFSGARIIGSYAKNFWFYEQEGGLFVIDQHAAHERVLYERFKKEFQARGIARQGLLIPLQFSPTPSEAELIETNLEAITRAGFSLAPFGDRLWMIDEQPADVRDGLEAFRSLLAVFAEPEKSAARGDSRVEKILTTMACHASLRSGDPATPELILSILGSLARLENPYSCPHGRPAIIAIKAQEVAAWFQRR